MAEETVRRTREELKKANADLTAEIAELKKLSLAFYKGLEELLSESDRQGLKTLRAELSNRADVSPEEMSHKIAEYFSNKLAKEVPVVQGTGRTNALEDALKAIVPPGIYSEVMAEPDPGKWCGLLKRLYDERFFGPLKKEAEETKKTRMLAKESSEEAKQLTERIASLEKEIKNQSAAAEEYMQKAESAAAEAKRLAGEKQLEFNARTAAEGKARDAEKKLSDAETVTGFAQQLQEQQVLNAQEDAQVAEALKADLEEKYAAHDAELKQVRAELRHANKLLDMQQKALDDTNSEKDRTHRELTTLSGLEKLQNYHKFFMEQLKAQPFLVGLLLKAAGGMGKVRQDMSDPSKTMDLTENLDWLLLHIVDVLPHVYEWTKQEFQLTGEVNIANTNLTKVIGAVKEYLPENERNLLEQRIQASKQAEAAIQAAQGTDKSQIKEPEPISAIVYDMLKFVNLQWHFDNEMLVEAVFGIEKSEEYLAIKDPQKKAEWVQENFKAFTEEYKKAAEAMAEQKVADALSAKEDAQRQQIAEFELGYKEKLIEIFALLPREIEEDSTEGILAKQFVSLKGPKADTQDISVDNLKSTIAQAVAQRADYKQRAEAAEENVKNVHAALGALDEELKQKEEYVKKIEASKTNLGQTIGEQAAKLQELAEKIGQKDVELYDKQNELESLTEKVQKLESGAGFKPTDYVLKSDHDAEIRQKEEDIALLKKISDGHISRDEHDAGVKAKEDEVRDEYLPVVVDQKKQIADLKDKMSELEKTLADKENTPGVLAAAFTDDAIANELADLRQQLEAANKRTVYNPDVHMPKSEHDAVLAAANANAYNPDVHMPKAENAVALAAKEAKVRDEYKPAVDRKEELERIAGEQKSALSEKEGKIIKLQQRLETAEAAKTAAEERLAGTQAYDPEKHITKEDYQAALAQKDEQLRGKQGEVDALSQAKSAAESMFAAAKAGALNPVDYILKSDYEKALADAKAASAEEKRVALEQKDAETRQHVDEKQIRINNLESAVQDNTTEIEQLRSERASLTVFDPAKHVSVDKYNSDLAQKDEQLRAKQDAVDALSQSKSGIETELAAAKANVYNPAVHMPKTEHERLLAEAKDASAEEKRVALAQKETELAAAKANVYNPAVHMPKAEHDAVLAAKEAEVRKEYKPAVDRKEELEKIVREKDAQIAGAVLYDSSKHVKKEDHEKIVGEQKSAYDAQLAEKQGELNGLAAAKSSLENELGQVKGRADTAERDKAALNAELTSAKANVYNPDKHVTKEDHQKVIDAASKNYASEAEQIRAKIKELEGQVVAVQQKISDCKDESLQKLMNAAERMAGLLKENRELYEKLNHK